MTERLYYPDDFTDEVMPCNPTLEGWAEWLANPDGEFGRTEPAQPGESWRGGAFEVVSITATYTAGRGWALDRTLTEAEATRAQGVYIRFGEGLGWDPELSADTVAEALELCRAEDGAVEHLAVLLPLPNGRLIFDIMDGQPVCSWVEEQ